MQKILQLNKTSKENKRKNIIKHLKTHRVCVGLKTNADINPTHWMTMGNHDVTNDLRVPDSER